MRIGRFLCKGEEHVGLIKERHVIPLSGDGACSSWAFGAPHQAPQGEPTPLGAVRLLPPVRGGRVFCVGFNYRDDVAEAAQGQPDRPVTFLRTAASIVGPDEPLWRPTVSECFDFGGELAAVIGLKGRHIAPRAALEHVFGFTCFMDGSVREFEKHAVSAGKTFDRTGSLGPWIVSRDEAPEWDAMQVITRLNGEVVQQSSTGLMIFGLPDLIAYLSRITTLLPGDVIATGTPAGVGAKRQPPLWMRPGDDIEVTVTGVGVLRNQVVDEPGGVMAAA
jgi:2-keto-4-pentenoate hydratase/2-oxohepta-3-ene-1,7-dioic acid hydratase in catechol pathway